MNNGLLILTKSIDSYQAGSICIFTDVPDDVAIARFVPAAITITQGSGLIPIDNAIDIAIGVIIAAVALFCIMFVKTTVNTIITTVNTATEAFFPPKSEITELAINSPPPDASNPVPRPVIAPMVINISQGKLANAFFTGTTFNPSIIVAPIIP